MSVAGAGSRNDFLTSKTGDGKGSLWDGTSLSPLITVAADREHSSAQILISGVSLGQEKEEGGAVGQHGPRPCPAVPAPDLPLNFLSFLPGALILLTSL